MKRMVRKVVHFRQVRKKEGVSNMARTKNLAVTAITLIAALVAVNTTNAQEKGEKAHAPQWETMCQDNTEETEDAKALSRVTGPGTLKVYPGFECRIQVRHATIACPDTSKLAVPSDIGATKTCRPMPSDVEPHQKGFGDSVRAQFSAPTELGTHNVTFTVAGKSQTVTLNVVARPLTPTTGWTRDEGEELTERVDELPGAQRRYTLGAGYRVYLNRSDSHRGNIEFSYGFGAANETRFDLGFEYGFASTTIVKSPIVIDTGEGTRMFSQDIGIKPGLSVGIGEEAIATFLLKGILGVGIHYVNDSPIAQYPDGVILMGDTGTSIAPLFGAELGFRFCGGGVCGAPYFRLDGSWEPDEHGAGDDFSEDLTFRVRALLGLNGEVRW